MTERTLVHQVIERRQEPYRTWFLLPPLLVKFSRAGQLSFLLEGRASGSAVARGNAPNKVVICSSNPDVTSS